MELKKKNWKFLGGWGVHKLPSEMEIPGGVEGLKLKNHPCGGGGVWIFSGITQFGISRPNCHILYMYMYFSFTSTIQLKAISRICENNPL